MLGRRLCAGIGCQNCEGAQEKARSWLLRALCDGTPLLAAESVSIRTPKALAEFDLNILGRLKSLRSLTLASYLRTSETKSILVL